MNAGAVSHARTRWRCSVPVLLGLLAVSCVASATAPPNDIELRAIEISQAALGNQVEALRFVDQHGAGRSLDEFRGRPVLLSLIYTACAQSCQVTTRQLDRLVRIARAALGNESFTVLTVGFDQPVDSPRQMSDYARRQGISDPQWHFLSSPESATVARLMEQVGFVYLPSPRGFDHTVQLTILDRDGRVHRQVYGEVFPTPQLIEPLKDLVFNRPSEATGLLDRIGDRIRLFCTVYDAQGDRYMFDYSLIAGMFIGTVFLGSAIAWLLVEIRRSRRSRPA
jgi:protein SCO1/2